MTRNGRKLRKYHWKKPDGIQFERTLFTSGYSGKTNTYYMNTYEDPAIRSFAMSDFDMDSSELITAD